MFISPLRTQRHSTHVQYDDHPISSTPHSDSFFCLKTLFCQLDDLLKEKQIAYQCNVRLPVGEPGLAVMVSGSVSTQNECERLNGTEAVT